MLLYAKGQYQLAIVTEGDHYKFIKESKSHVAVERGTKEEMTCLFKAWVGMLRNASTV